MKSLTTYLNEGGFSSCTSTKTIFCHKLNAKVDIIQLSSIKSNVKKICKNIKLCHSPTIFLKSGFKNIYVTIHVRIGYPYYFKMH